MFHNVNLPNFKYNSDSYFSKIALYIMKKTTYDSDFLSQLTFEPLTRANWGKFVQLFGDKGACGKSSERAGFEIVDHTSKNRPMVRYYIDKEY